MEWDDLPLVILDWTEKTAAVGWDVRQQVCSLVTKEHAGYYYNPITSQVGIFAPLAANADLARIKSAAYHVTNVEPLFLSYQDLTDENCAWVKIAYSQALRRAGELTNFFPGQFPGGIPNSPSPVAAMLTSGLIGAGAGWGGGKLLGALMPGKFGKKLSRTGLILGGLLGAVPGAVWGGTNRLAGRSFDDPSLLSPSPGSYPVERPASVHGSSAMLTTPESEHNEFLENVRTRLEAAPPSTFRSGAYKFSLDQIELGSMCKTAIAKVAETFGEPAPNLGRLPTDVNIDALGRTLWDTGASPQLAATTMAGMYAAQQMPDHRSRPGWVTGNQLGQLTMNAVGDYAKGYLVGAAVNAAIGTPFRSSHFGLGNAAIGIIGAVVPKLFGG